MPNFPDETDTPPDLTGQDAPPLSGDDLALEAWFDQLASDTGIHIYRVTGGRRPVWLGTATRSELGDSPEAYLASTFGGGDYRLQARTRLGSRMVTVAIDPTIAPPMRGGQVMAPPDAGGLDEALEAERKRAHELTLAVIQGKGTGGDGGMGAVLAAMIQSQAQTAQQSQALLLTLLGKLLDKPAAPTAPAPLEGLHGVLGLVEKLDRMRHGEPLTEPAKPTLGETIVSALPAIVEGAGHVLGAMRARQSPGVPVPDVPAEPPAPLPSLPAPEPAAPAPAPTPAPAESPATAPVVPLDAIIITLLQWGLVDADPVKAVELTMPHRPRLDKWLAEHGRDAAKVAAADPRWASSPGLTDWLADFITVFDGGKLED